MGVNMAIRAHRKLRVLWLPGQPSFLKLFIGSMAGECVHTLSINLISSPKPPLVYKRTPTVW